ncbi:MAG TPA: IS21 family transposase [Microbacterium sp.]|nr:IS21 family transposase [Microbacterium sp.]
MISMEDWAEIRRLHRAENLPIKAIARRLGIARNTVRSALASDAPPKYQRAGKQSLVDAAEPEVRKLLMVDAKMPATVIAQRIGWQHSLTILKDRIRMIRPEYAGVDPADRLVHEPGQAAQMDLWFPEPRIPVGFGQAAMLPVLVMTLTYSRFLSAVMLPSRQGGDLLAGMWQLIAQVGAVSKTLVWDREAAIGGKGVVTAAAAAFAGTLATRVVLAPPRDPEFKGMTERNNGFLETSFLPGRQFTSPADFNTQLADWLPIANARTVRSLSGRPVEVLDRDIAAMTALPPRPPATGLQTRVRLGRDYYVRVDGNDYSVDPRMIGRLVDVTATLSRVIVVCDGTAVADHARCWATGAVITDPAHVMIAKGLRSQYSAAKRDRERAARAMPAQRVMFRDTSDYDVLFGVDFDPTTGEVL